MLASAFVLGLLGSFHCVGMCGPIAFLLPLDRQSKTKRLYEIISYHSGRLLTYALTINPEMHEAWAGRGQELSDLHRYPEAIRDFSQAIIYDRENADYFYLIPGNGPWKSVRTCRALGPPMASTLADV